MRGGGGGAHTFFMHTGDQNSFFIKNVSASGSLLIIHFQFLFLQTNKIFGFRFLNSVCSSTYSSVAV